MNNTKITKPEVFFGEMPGSDGLLIHWNKLCEYYRLLEKESKKIKVVSPGKSSEGNEFLVIFVAASATVMTVVTVFIQADICRMFTRHTEFTTDFI